MQRDGFEYNATKVFCRDINADGRAEVFLSDSENSDTISWYENPDPQNDVWIEHVIADDMSSVHTLQVYDMDRDGDYDVLAGENGDRVAPAQTVVFLNEGDNQDWERRVIGEVGSYNGLVGDVDGDGDLDLFRLPEHAANEFQLILNESALAMDLWDRHLVDDTLADAPTSVLHGDVDGDGDLDIVAGSFWWENPGAIADVWGGHTIGSPLNSAAIVSDFDADGDLDIFGTQGYGAQANNQLAWAENDGAGSFTIHTNIGSAGTGDFLQGAVVAEFGDGPEIALSWHNGGGGVYSVKIPRDPVADFWPIALISSETQAEELSVGDIDRDGDNDLLLGTVWLRNDGAAWSAQTLGSLDVGMPDRNALQDMNGDGRLDAVVSLEGGTDVFWFEAPVDPAQPWTRRVIGTVEGQGFSMDVADLDGDGDPDVVVGEHRGTASNRVILFENTAGALQWSPHVLDSDSAAIIDHHDGTQAVDLDADGDMDLLSIGWYNPALWIYENRSVQ